MPTPIAMPSLGMTMTEGMVVAWPLELGSQVEHGDVVLVIESDKSEIDVEATGRGTLAHIYVEPEEVVPCGTLLAVLLDDTDANFDPAEFLANWKVEQAQADGATDSAPELPDLPPLNQAPSSPSRRDAAPATPAARKLARELGVDLDTVTGSGPGGRITREDVEERSSRQPQLTPVAQGVALEVPSSGEGEPVLLLPGFGTDASAFAAQSPALIERFAVRAVNPRGVGASDAPPDDVYDIATMAADVAALIESPAHLIATSLGTAVAIELALTQPEKVASLSLLAPLVRVDARLGAVSRAWCSLAGAGNPSLLAETLLPWFFGRATLADEKRRAQILRGLGPTLARVPAATLGRVREGMLAWSGSRSEALGQLRVPTLVITGDEDLLTPDGAAIAAGIPGARLESLPGAGHAVGLEDPATVNTLLLDHLSAAKPPQN